MATNLNTRKPNFKNARSHALNITKTKQKVNLQKTTINGEKVMLSVRDARTLRKNAA